MQTFHSWSKAYKYDMKLNINQRKIKASCKKIVMSWSEHYHLCFMMVTRFSKKKITLVLLNHMFVVLIRGSFKINFKVRFGVFLNNETDLALTIHFHLLYQIQNKGFLSTIRFVYGLNYAKNFILHRPRGA